MEAIEIGDTSKVQDNEIRGMMGIEMSRSSEVQRNASSNGTVFGSDSEVKVSRYIRAPRKRAN